MNFLFKININIAFSFVDANVDSGDKEFVERR
jgi:hypothetical protein